MKPRAAGTGGPGAASPQQQKQNGAALSCRGWWALWGAGWAWVLRPVVWGSAPALPQAQHPHGGERGVQGWAPATGQTLRGCSVSRDGHGAGEGAAAPAGGAQPGETGLGGDPIALRLPEGAGAGGSVSSPREPATGQEGTAPGCARGGSGGISGEIPSRKGWPGRGTGCPGTGCCHRPRGGSKPPQAPCLGTRFSGGLGSAGLGAGLGGLKGLLQPEGFCDLHRPLYLPFPSRLRKIPFLADVDYFQLRWNFN